MNKNELVRETSKVTGFTQKDIEAVVDTLNAVKLQALANGEVVKDGIITLEPKETKARTARNPKTGETVDVPAGKKVAVKQSKALKESVK